ncbi:MAG: trigger factor [Blastocatellia bacterium]|nr:trigger factor [Blastocatellia bacterium]
MEVAIADVSQCAKDLTIEVAADEVKAEFEKVYDLYSRNVKVPGFRPGRVPRSVIKQRFNKEIKDEVAGEIVPHALSHALQDHKLRAIAEPSLLDLSVVEGEPLKFTARIEILAEFDLGAYKGLKATRRTVKVAEEEVEQTIARLQESHSEVVPVEGRPSEPGDIVSINIVGKYVDPAEDEDLKTDGLDVELGAEGVQQEFTDNLTGVSAGDVRTFRVVYPADFTSEGLAGKTLDFTADVIAVRKKELPELDDEFARQLGYGETMDEMRAQIRDDLQNEARNRADAALRNALVTQLLDLHAFDVPESLVTEQTYKMANDFANSLARMGLPRNAIKNWDWDSHLKESRGRAVNDLRASLIISKIGSTENLTVTDEELESELVKIAVQANVSIDEVKASLTKEDALSSIQNRLLYEKTVAFIIDSSEITDEEITAEQAQAEKEQAERERAEKAQAELAARETAEQESTESSAETQAAQQS